MNRRRCSGERGASKWSTWPVAGYRIGAWPHGIYGAAWTRYRSITEPMKTTFLDFEQPIAELEAKIEELRFVQDDSALDISEEIARLQAKGQALLKDIYAKLTPWQVSQLARHPQRPYTLDYIAEIFTDFHELHGDRVFADDLAIVGGLARFNGQAVMLIGHQKGRDTKERALRNFGMPRPEGYRKALRLMQLAEKFGLPLLTFIDTPGAYPGSMPKSGASRRRLDATCSRWQSLKFRSWPR